MKNSKTLLIAAMLIVTFVTSQTLFAQGRGNFGNRGNKGNTGGINASAILADLPFEDLSEAEINDLLHMREEEKLAHDVYQVLYEKWQTAVFTNIAKSEQQHTDMVKLLIDKYELEDPFQEETGKFSNADLQAIYNSLVESGSQSLIEALYVGLTIEDLDIYDLHETLERTDNQDITLVYTNLLKGSRNHMRAFNNLYSAQDLTYEPQYISVEEFTEIIESAIERGGNGQGRGKGLGKKNINCTNPANQQGSIETSNSTFKASNYPNPANPGTTIQFSLEEPANVTLKIYNIRGQLVMDYDMGYLGEGIHSQNWNGTNRYGQHMSSGMYFYEINTGSQKIVNKLSLLK